MAWFKRVEMADSKLSTSSWTFKQLCWPKLHGKVEPYKVAYLRFKQGERDESTGIFQSKLEKGSMRIEIPIACVPPPKYIIGFDRIKIRYEIIIN